MTMPASDTAANGRWSGRIARATIAAAVLVLLAGPAISSGVLPWQAGLGMFVLAALLAGIGGVISLVALLRRRGGTLVVLAAAAGLAAFAIPAAIVAGGSGVPPINDITTDMIDPPAFAAITAEMRGAGSAPLAYNPACAAQQAKGYPALKPLIIADAPAAAFDKALAAAIDGKDKYTRGHSERVSRISVAIGRQLGLEAEELETLRISSLLHDVGMGHGSLF